MTKDEALNIAIEFMETLTIDVGIKTWNEKRRKEAIQACKEALEQPAQEPVAAVQEGIAKWYFATPKNGTLLYTRPASSWQELSDVELSLLAEKYTGADGLDVVDYGRAVMQAYGEKNHG